ncbi:HK97 gp10 family phage protein [Streptococcus pluranimalium]|uniref:HK97 gp10 family phage protein n=1 Tax=Helcococcus bovis TaxID=3153252 RepID=A0ABW9F788_9FIRM|nr:HK97 gp10 family phage protein [Streptococcus agalactiae]HEM2695160.1 HK97 gp10 family phage protein [Streptococcus suis]KAF1268412.1 hypothetical protein B8V77_04320 [Streptococcus agalactiae]MCD0151477.1 HK97 gp10 family phage protein [Streptococcus agalactiae]RRA51984.1 HK97 gp10 family phage protein [Streptococcus agalactiae]HEM2709483.1 HK97 gp10 family phage protein [Streptococcus suis]
MKVKVDDMANAIQKELEKYQKVTTEQLKKVIKEVGKETKEMIQSSAPKKSGKYAKSWAVKRDKETSGSLSVVVHSRNKYQLTHLLEFGHAKRGGGRTRAMPHIANAEKQAVSSFEQKVKEILEND